MQRHAVTMTPKNWKFEECLDTRKKKIETDEIPMRKYLGPTQDSWEKNLDQRNTYEKKFWIHDINMKEWWY